MFLGVLVLGLRGRAQDEDSCFHGFAADVTVIMIVSLWKRARSARPGPLSAIEARVVAPAASVLVAGRDDDTLVCRGWVRASGDRGQLPAAEVLGDGPTILVAAQGPDPAEQFDATISLLFATPIAPTERTEGRLAVEARPTYADAAVSFA